MTGKEYWTTETENLREILRSTEVEDKNYLQYQKALAGCERRLEEMEKHEAEMRNMDDKEQRKNKDNWFDKVIKAATIIVPVAGTCITAYIVSKSNIKQELIHQEGQLRLQQSELEGGKSMLTAAQNEARRNIPTTKLNLRS